MNNAAASTEYEGTIDTELTYTSFKWYLKKWSVMAEHYKTGVKTAPFVITGTGKDCTLMFYLAGDSTYCSVTFPNSLTFVTMQYSVSFVNEDMKSLLKRKSKPLHNSIIQSGDSCIMMCTPKELNSTTFILNDTLIILFEVELVRKVVLPIIRVDSFQGRVNIVHNNYDLYNNTDFCDIEFFFKKTEKTLIAHKHILTARSPVFRAMFKTDMKELQTGTVTIEDFDDTVFEKFLCYVYTGEVDVSENDACELMTIAGKYQVLRLIDLCARYMTEHIDDKNALNYLITARQHSVTNLEQRAIAYIKKNTKVLAQAAADDSLSESLPAMIQLIFSQ